jgi:hypothetical protein
MSGVHGIFGEQSLTIQQQMAEMEARTDQARQYVEQVLAQGRMMGATATNLEAQMGRGMMSEEFERHAKKLVRSLWTTDHPANPNMRVMYALPPNGEKEYISAYEKGLMPEYSVFESTEEETYDPSYLGPGARKTRRADLPRILDFKLEADLDPKSPNYGDVRGPGFVFDNSQPRPGLIRRTVPGRELRRGWRTVAARLVWPKMLTSPELLEREFSTGERDSWAAAMGRGVGKF